ncbi:microfibril-associated glycoprotein 4-like [Symphorus nematophorus]
MVHLYAAIIESILTSSITIWYAAVTARDQGGLQRVIRSDANVIGCNLLSLQDLYTSRPLRRAGKIVPPPSDRRLQSIRTKTSRHKNSSFPSATGFISNARSDLTEFNSAVDPPLSVMMMVQVTLFIALLALAASVQSDLTFFLPIDCDDIYRNDNTTLSGVYTIYPGGPTAPLKVYCDMDTDGGGWTVFQRRMDGTESFFRPWSHYKTGFGNVGGEYWLGLENIFLLTMRKKNELRVDMEAFDEDKGYAKYSSFSIDNENAGYQLHLGSYDGGPAGDSLTEHNNKKFTTFDKDQDMWDKNCARHYLGGFWYNACHHSNPNGMYAPHGAIAFDNVHVIWHTWKGWNHSLKAISMKIRSTATCPCKH